MTNREEFEVWAIKVGLSVRTSYAMSGESYIDSSTYWAYEGWAAAHEAAPTSPTPEADHG